MLFSEAAYKSGYWQGQCCTKRYKEKIKAFQLKKIVYSSHIRYRCAQQTEQLETTWTFTKRSFHGSFLPAFLKVTYENNDPVYNKGAKYCSVAYFENNIKIISILQFKLGL